VRHRVPSGFNWTLHLDDGLFIKPKHVAVV
jgi:hypothetical protein